MSDAEAERTDQYTGNLCFQSSLYTNHNPGQNIHRPVSSSAGTHPTFEENQYGTWGCHLPLGNRLLSGGSVSVQRSNGLASDWQCLFQRCESSHPEHDGRIILSNKDQARF